MSDHRVELVRLLAELDQQLAAAEECLATVAGGIADMDDREEIVEGLRAAIENVEMQLDRDRRAAARV